MPCDFSPLKRSGRTMYFSVSLICIRRQLWWCRLFGLRVLVLKGFLFCFVFWWGSWFLFCFVFWEATYCACYEQALGDIFSKAETKIKWDRGFHTFFSFFVSYIWWHAIWLCTLNYQVLVSTMAGMQKERGCRRDMANLHDTQWHWSVFILWRLHPSCYLEEKGKRRQYLR